MYSSLKSQLFVALFTIHLLRLEAQHKLFGVIKMGLLDEVGKIAGAIIAEQGVDKLDPDAGFLEKQQVPLLVMKQQKSLRKNWKIRTVTSKSQNKQVMMMLNF